MRLFLPALLLASSAFAADKPNIVFIMADDLGWRDLGCFGSTFHQTPHVDKLAARGVKFTQAYAANPLCSPTRSSVLTGLWPARTGITAPACHLPQVVLEKKLVPGNPKTRVLTANSVTRLKTDYVTLPKVLHGAGYRTGHFGKWHLGPEPYSPLQHGFDVDWPHWSGPGPAGSYVAPWAPAFPAKGNPGEHIEDRLSAEVVKFIHQNKDRPFFVNYWQFSVHAPYDAQDTLVEKYRKSADPRSAQRNPVYAAMVQSLDDGVGRVMTALEKCGLLDKTIIVYFSDNGGVSWGGRDQDGGVQHKSARFQADMTAPPTSNLPLRNGKASVYEGGVREPCIVVWPGVTKPGTTSDTVIQSIDWMPTLLEMAGVPLPADAKPDGLSIVPALKGGTLEREAIFCHFPHDTPASGQHPATTVRRGDWKLHRIYAGSADGTDLLELYNLRDDIGETRNLAAEKPELVGELNALITGFLKETGAVIPKLNPSWKADTPQDWQVSPDTRLTGKDGTLHIVSTGPHPWLYIRDLSVKARGPFTMKLRMRSTASGDGVVHYSTKDGYRTGQFITFPARHDGEFHEYEVKLPTESITAIRLDPATAPGDIFLTSLVLLDAAGKQVKDLMLRGVSVESEEALQRRLEWFHAAKYGLFIHWGIWAIPAGEWKGTRTSTDPSFISMEAGIPLEEYRALAQQFNPTQFDAEDWARLAVDAGTKYITYVAKHSDGFAMYHSKVSPFNVFDATPWKRDPLAELRVACDRHGIKLCVYYSQAVDADDPGGVTVAIPKDRPTFPMRDQAAFDRYLGEKSLPQLKELLTRYGELGLIWFDVPVGMTKERTRPFVDAVRSLRPDTLISSRVGVGPWDYKSMGDNQAPTETLAGAWETAGTLNWSWGYRKFDEQWKSPETVCFSLVDIVSKGGNYSLSVGPKADGTFPQAAQDILRKVGAWLKVNGEAIYGAGRTPFGAEFGPPVLVTVEDNRRVPASSGRDWRCTTKPGRLYIHVFRRPSDGKQTVPMSNAVTKAVVLGDALATPLAVKQTAAGLEITLPERLDPLATVIAMDVQGAVQPLKAAK